MENATNPQFVLEPFITATDAVFEPGLTLEHLSSIKILVELWNKKPIREKLLCAALEFHDSRTPSNSQIWGEVLYQIAIDVAKLNLPRRLSQKLWDINTYVSKSLQHWLNYAYHTFYFNSDRIDLGTCNSYFQTTLSLFWNALSKSNNYEMKFCNDLETCTKFQNSFLALWYNIPKSLEARIHEDANMIALVLYFLPWDICLHVIYRTIHKIDDSQKKEVITSKYGRLKCIYFIKRNEWQFYNLYTSYMLPNKEDLFKYKQYLINAEGEKTAVHFFQNKAIKNGKEYLQFCHKIENQLDDKGFFVKYFIKYRHWDLLEIYLNLFCDEKEQYEIKKGLLTEQGIKCAEWLVENTTWPIQIKFLDKFFKTESKCDKKNVQLLRRYIFETFRRGGDDKCDFAVLICFVKWSVGVNSELDEGNLRLLGETVLRYFDELEGKKVDDLLSTIFRSNIDLVRDQFRDKYFRKS